MTKRNWKKFSAAGGREGGDESGEVERGLSLQRFGGDVSAFVFHPKGAERSLRRSLSLSLLQAEIEGKNGDRGISWRLMAGVQVRGMDGSGPGGDSRDEEEWVDSQVCCEEHL